MKYWNNNLKKMSEYIPGEQPDNIDEFIKLNTNENAFPPSEKVLEAIRKSVNGNLRRYPTPSSKKVRELFAEKYSLSPDNVFVANGSDEIFTLIFRGFIEKRGLAAFPYPSYSLYYTMSEANAIKYEKVNLDSNFNINFDEFLEKKYDLVIFCNPNNPTGNGIDLNKLKDFLNKYEGLCVVDEAYVDFYGESAISLIKTYDNLIVTRSFSKSYSLAGMRIGLAIAHSDIIKGFNKIKDSYNVDSLAQAAATASLMDTKSFEYNLNMIRNNKEYLEEELEVLDFETIPSKANFVFTKHKSIDSEKIYEELKKRKVLIRHFKGDIQSEYIRITVGTMMELKKLLNALREITADL